MSDLTFTGGAFGICKFSSLSTTLHNADYANLYDRWRKPAVHSYWVIILWLWNRDSTNLGLGMGRTPQLSKGTFLQPLMLSLDLERSFNLQLWHWN